MPASHLMHLAIAYLRAGEKSKATRRSRACKAPTAPPTSLAFGCFTGARRKACRTRGRRCLHRAHLQDRLCLALQCPRSRGSLALLRYVAVLEGANDAIANP